jgi:hypothetical protein
MISLDRYDLSGQVHAPTPDTRPMPGTRCTEVRGIVDAHPGEGWADPVRAGRTRSGLGGPGEGWADPVRAGRTR